jgi:hypothetical protein
MRAMHTHTNARTQAFTEQKNGLKELGVGFDEGERC